MDHKINRQEIISHVKNVAFDLATDLYEEKELLSGKDIMNATSIEQVNYFILKSLFSNWKKEMGKMKSPYFNYDSPEVIAAFQKLGDTLSYQISLKQEVFVKLLEEALISYIDFLTTPYQYILNTYLPENNSRLKASELKDTLKYYRINSFFIKLILDKLSSYKLNELSFDDGKNCIMEVFEASKNKLEDPAPYLSELASIYGFPFDEPKNTEQVKFEKPVHAPEPAEQEVPKAAPEFDYTKKGNATLNDLYSEYSKSKNLNEELKSKNEESTILQKHQKTKINSLVNSIAINQKYHFINTLFHGDAASFEEAIKTLDASPSKDEASRLIAVDFTEKYGWDESKDPDVSKLLQLVERRF